MKTHFKFLKVNLILLICFISAFLAAGIVYAVINSIDTGFKAVSGVESTIDLTTPCGECKKVTRTATGDIFVPTKSCAEWNAFKANATGVTLADCGGGGGPFVCGTSTVTDIDGNIYNTVQIGTQCWMKENMKVTKNPSGEPITRYCYPLCPAWPPCSGDYCSTDGGLYDWNTAMNGSSTPGSQGICPNGWHIPIDDGTSNATNEWYTLESYLKDGANPCDGTRSFGWACDTAGDKLKAAPYGSGSNSSGFSAPMAGRSFTPSNFGNKATYAFFWTSNQAGDNAWFRDLYYAGSMVGRDQTSKMVGFSVRCIKNVPPSQVTGLTAAAGNAQAILNWSAPASDGGSAITNYKIYRDTVSGFVPNAGNLIIPVGNVLTYTNTGLTNGTTYYYKVSAANAIGEGAQSVEASATPVASPIPCPGTPTVKDIDGNTYNTVQIGTQCWMKENLNKGTRIDKMINQNNNVPVNSIEKYCRNNKNSGCDGGTPETKWGGLYQWNEAMNYSTVEGAQGICPSGFHIPTDAELYTLENYLKDGTNSCDGARDSVYDCANAGTKLKLGGSSGFSGIIAGYRHEYGTLFPNGNADFWSSTESGMNAQSRNLYYQYSTVWRGLRVKERGHSVRCIKN